MIKTFSSLKIPDADDLELLSFLNILGNIRIKSKAMELELLLHADDAVRDKIHPAFCGCPYIMTEIPKVWEEDIQNTWISITEESAENALLYHLALDHYLSMVKADRAEIPNKAADLKIIFIQKEELKYLPFRTEKREEEGIVALPDKESVFPPLHIITKEDIAEYGAFIGGDAS